jgi:hypothetical protein
VAAAYTRTPSVHDGGRRLQQVTVELLGCAGRRVAMELVGCCRLRRAADEIVRFELPE